MHAQRNSTQVLKNEILPSETRRMNSDGIMLSEISQTVKDKYCMLSLTWRI